MDCNQYIWKSLEDEDSIYQHINERYSLMNDNSDIINQDLGIIDDKTESITIEIDFQKETNKSDKKKKKVTKSLSNYTIELKQSLTSLKSNVNGNSTTGFVVWQSTRFFLNWLLNHNGLSFLDWNNKQYSFIELGTGVNCSNSIILSNYSKDYFISTDQKGILNKLEENSRNNLNEIQIYNKTCKYLSETQIKDGNVQTKEKFFISKSLKKNEFLLDLSYQNLFHYEIEHLDWCDNITYDSFIICHGTMIKAIDSKLVVLAVDVIYNEFLIMPFLKTLKKLLSFKPSSEALVVLQLRDESIILDFLFEALELGIYVQTIDDAGSELIIGCSRHAIYKLSLIHPL
ncbi:uncharacterized protein HGUI_03135 [Hanseniaspora guilliermondii]|uniref:Ribosomal lysine N-methyltransferase 5 n=1 Tax=Hanseniaspora guilliermondii TaxID=56406 RepID=A0A1L0D1D2_9ASCO|nr:uncharacterized protein HGUI_03135 [Hanseniaspora guilliermondii]